MIQHVYERTSQATFITSVLVATDNDRVMAAVQRFGGHAVMTPESLQTGTDRVAYVASSLPDADIVVNVQGDEPLIEPAMIDEAVKPLLDDATISVGTLVKRIANEHELVNPGTVKVVLDQHGNGIYFSRSPIPFGRDIPQRDWLKHHAYFKHFGLYVFRKDFLMSFAATTQTPLEMMEKLEQLRIIERGHTIRCTVTSFDSIPVDTEEDLKRVQRIVETTQ